MLMPVMVLDKKKTSSRAQKNRKVASGPLNHLFKTGKRARRGFLAIHWSEVLTGQTKGKLYLGVSKRLLAKAVDRNRAKRIIREIVRKWLEGKKMNRNLLIRLAEKPASLSSLFFRESLSPLLDKIKKTS